MKICILAAGAAGMYCGSCLRDNALASALIRMGHEVSLVPLYTPIRTDSPSVSGDDVFYGGVNTYLQFASSLFRHTPRAVDWLFDRPWLLHKAGEYGANTPPAKLGPFILSILRGEEGPQIKELRRLVAYLKDQVKPEVVTLPNAMFIGMAKMLREEVGAPVVCELTGEDIFLDAMAEPHRSMAREIIRGKTGDVDRFVATSRYYAEKMSQYLAVEAERIEVVYPGIAEDHLAESKRERSDGSPPTVGYLARVCPEKGVDRLVEAMALLRRMAGMERARLRVAGYLGPGHVKWFDEVRAGAKERGVELEYAGEVDLAGKLAFLDSLDVLSVPTAYPEPKGMYVLEALARGVPVVQPDHGAFPELLAQTGGGMLVPPNDAPALAEALAGLLADDRRREALGRAGQAAVRERFLDRNMADRMLEIFEGVRR